MKPAASIVFFTTASGAGFGMLAWIGLLALFGVLPDSPLFGLVALALAFALSTAGLLSSTFHLGHPERAWRALSQWRSSWLSREGVAALLTYVPMALLALLWLLDGVPSAALAVAAGALAAVTVFCTAMIYASLKTVRQWHDRRVPVFYLLAALFTGALCLAAVASLCLPAAPWPLPPLTLLSGLLAGWVKVSLWQHQGAGTQPTTADATGLGQYGTVRSFEAPHTEENYLLKEFAFTLARKHATRLRRHAALLAFILPVLLVAVALLGILPGLSLCAAAVLSLAGMLVERWLFFAEATHLVTLYYARG